MHMAQPPFSQRIRQLESELNVKLFERHTRKVSLSGAGKVFFEKIQPVLAQLDGAVEACRQADRGTNGQLRLGYTGRASQILLPLLVRVCGQRFPDVVLNIDGPHPTGALRLMLLNGELDVALCFLPLDEPRIESRAYAACEFVLALSATHRLASLSDVSLRMLEEDSFVGYPANKGFHLRATMDLACRRAGFLPRVARETETSQVLMSLIAAGVGVSIVPEELQALDESKGIVFKALGAECPSLSHGMAWLRNNQNPVLKNLLQIDLQQLQ